MHVVILDESRCKIGPTNLLVPRFEVRIMPQISEKRPIGILAVDDHPLLREGLAAAIGAAPDMKLQGEGN